MDVLGENVTWCLGLKSEASQQRGRCGEGRHRVSCKCKHISKRITVWAALPHCFILSVTIIQS